MDDVGLDHQVVVEEAGGMAVVGEDPADLGRREEDGVGAGGVEPTLDRRLVGEVDLGAAGGHDFAAFARQTAHQGRAHHPAMARDPDPLAGELVGRRRPSPGRPAPDRRACGGGATGEARTGKRPCRRCRRHPS